MTLLTPSEEPAGATPSTPPLIIIRPETSWVGLNLRELWAYRNLIYFFCWRDLKVRYKETNVGAFLVLVQPFFTIALYTIFFGRLAQIPSEGLPYPLFIYCALVPWNFFVRGMNGTASSLATAGTLLQKVYFPRLVLPINTMLVGLIDFATAFLLFLGMMVFYGYVPTLQTIWLPCFLLLALITAFGMGLWLAALSARSNDVGPLIPLLTQLWFYATPIAYPGSLLHEPWRTLYQLNPMVAVVEGFRWALLGTAFTPGPMILVAALLACAILLSGLYYFRRVEAALVDYL